MVLQYINTAMRRYVKNLRALTEEKLGQGRVNRPTTVQFIFFPKT